jgi:acetyl-CoA carboxylase biotin carboxyl carrier protein
MDIRKIKKLIEVLEESNIGEIEIREGDQSVRLTRARNDSVPFKANSDYVQGSGKGEKSDR